MRQLSRLFSVILLAGASLGSWILFGGVWASESKGGKRRATLEAVAKQFAPMGYLMDKVKIGDVDGDRKEEVVAVYVAKIDYSRDFVVKVLKPRDAGAVELWQKDCEACNSVDVKIMDVTLDRVPEVVIWEETGQAMLVVTVVRWDGKDFQVVGEAGADHNAVEVEPGKILRGVLFDNQLQSRAGESWFLHELRWSKQVGTFIPTPLARDFLKEDKPKRVRWPYGYEVGGRSPGSLAAYKVRTAPRIDGSGVLFDFDEKGNRQGEYPMETVIGISKKWEAPATYFYETEDEAAWWNLGWNEKALYIGVVVANDNRLVQRWRGADLWRGDHIELWIDADLQGDYDVAKADADDFQIGISPGNKEGSVKPELYCWFPRGKAGAVTGGQVGVSFGSGWTIEAAIPWRFLGVTPKKGMVFGFSFCVSDTDTPDRPQERFLFWPDSHKWGDPKTWGNLWLLKED